MNEMVARYYRRRLPGLREVGHLPLGRVKLERPRAGAPARSQRLGAAGTYSRSPEHY